MSFKDLETVVTTTSTPSVETATPTVSLPSTSQTKEEEKEEDGAIGIRVYEIGVKRLKNKCYKRRRGENWCKRLKQ